MDSESARKGWSQGKWPMVQKIVHLSGKPRDELVKKVDPVSKEF